MRNTEAMRTKIQAASLQKSKALRLFALRCAYGISENCTNECMKPFLAMIAQYPDGDVPALVLEKVQKTVKEAIPAMHAEAQQAAQQAFVSMMEERDNALLDAYASDRIEAAICAAMAAMAACHPEVCHAVAEAIEWTIACKVEMGEYEEDIEKALASGLDACLSEGEN